MNKRKHYDPLSWGKTEFIGYLIIAFIALAVIGIAKLIDLLT